MERQALAAVWKKLGHLVEADVPLLEALEVLRDEQEHAPLAAALGRLADGLLEGRSFSDGMAAETALFGADAVLLIRSAEWQSKIAQGALRLGAMVESGLVAPPEGAAVRTAERAIVVPPLVQAAVDAGATAIHVDATRDGGTVRFRIAGPLVPHATLDRAGHRRLVAQLKALSCLDLAETRLPQDGRVRARIRDRDVGFRLAVLAGHHGESVCVRFDAAEPPLPVADGAFFGDAELAARVRDVARCPYGLLLISGPAGSGRSTTLRALLSELDAGSAKIMVAEKAPGSALPGVHHATVRPWIGLTFPALLRSFLRADPDVIGADDIPDGETARLLLEAASGGYLVHAALIAPDAVSAVRRLVEMGMDRTLLADVLAGSLNQRLVRTLCPACRAPSPRETARLRELAGPRVPEGAVAYEAPGCAACAPDGYIGRRALFEYLSFPPAVRALIRRGDTEGLAEEARRSGFSTLFEQSIPLLLRGETSLAEVLRVASNG